ncbi:hypothetical protein CASFOL_024076 [Castilleja foliolosa]|uniref:Uncharacterized protein n=1 Tax=Castilleja foliolosa TaxID=1961234 RepID=A0ABD3CND4_9LAMI
MLYSNKPPLILPYLFVLFIFSSTHLSLAHDSEINEIKGRTLMGFKETPDGGNITFDCSPSGPCIPCSRSEKNDEKYRCGETGYRIRLKCASSVPVTKDAKKLEARKTRSMIEHRDPGVNQLDDELAISSKRQRRLFSVSSKSTDGSGAYVTYRSCIPAVNEEKLSVLGFEALMLGLLMSSGSFIYFRRKRSNATAGGAAIRLPTRF